MDLTIIRLHLSIDGVTAACLQIKLSMLMEGHPSKFRLLTDSVCAEGGIEAVF